MSARIREDLPPVEVVSPLPFTVTDLRKSTDPLSHLEELELHPDTQFWWEIDCPAEIPGMDRLRLRPCHTLVIATVPPDRPTLAAALLQTQPSRVVLFGHIPPTDSERNLLSRLGGLIRFVQNNREGKIMLDELASACASTPSAIRFGLEWWQAKGSIQIDWLEDGQVEIKQIASPNPTALPQIEGQLELVLAETTAFRAYYRRAPVTALLRV